MPCFSSRYDRVASLMISSDAGPEEVERSNKRKGALLSIGCAISPENIITAGGCEDLQAVCRQQAVDRLSDVRNI